VFSLDIFQHCVGGDVLLLRSNIPRSALCATLDTDKYPIFCLCYFDVLIANWQQISNSQFVAFGTCYGIESDQFLLFYTTIGNNRYQTKPFSHIQITIRYYLESELMTRASL
jgi:hypothetical protein